jgi:hypothetical protein
MYTILLMYAILFQAHLMYAILFRALSMYAILFSDSLDVRPFLFGHLEYAILFSLFSDSFQAHFRHAVLFFSGVLDVLFTLPTLGSRCANLPSPSVNTCRE